MRLDKYLQVTGLIKRRTLASEACKLGLVRVNDVVAKAMREIFIDDIIDISFARRELSVKVLRLVTGNSLKKAVRHEYIETIRDIQKMPDNLDSFWDEDKDD